MITEIASMVGGALGLTNRLIDGHAEKEFSNEANDLLMAWNNAQAINDSVARADAEFDVLVRVLAACGSTSRCDARCVGVPVDALAELVRIAIEYNKQQKQLNRLMMALEKR